MHHLTKRDVAVDPFSCGFINVSVCDLVEKIDVNLRIGFSKKLN